MERRGGGEWPLVPSAIGGIPVWAQKARMQSSDRASGCWLGRQRTPVLGACPSGSAVRHLAGGGPSAWPQQMHNLTVIEYYVTASCHYWRADDRLDSSETSVYRAPACRLDSMTMVRLAREQINEKKQGACGSSVGGSLEVTNLSPLSPSCSHLCLCLQRRR